MRCPGHLCHLIDTAPRRTGSLPHVGHDVNLTRTKSGTGKNFITHKGSCKRDFCLNEKQAATPQCEDFKNCGVKRQPAAKITFQFHI